MPKRFRFDPKYYKIDFVYKMPSSKIENNNN